MIVILALVWTTAASAKDDRLKVQTIEFDAPSVERTMKYNIVLPDGYKRSKKRYPVLYLLHGLTSNYTLWSMMGVPEYAAQYEMIVVMPDVGNSWYVNWAESLDGQKNNWEDYMINDVIGHVDTNYRTIAQREGRAINGLSMGGYGAFILGLRHPEMFCSIGSHSGALSYVNRYRERIASGDTGTGQRSRALSEKPAKIIDIEGFSSQFDRTPKGKPFTTVEQCDAYDPFKLVLEIPRDQLPHLHIDCGTEDGLIRSARAMQTLLTENTIPFSYAESSGAHLPAYWTREVAHSMAVQYNVIQRNLATLETD